jgi:hypothetical protein
MSCKRTMLEPLDFLIGAIGTGLGIASNKFIGDQIISKISNPESKVVVAVKPALGLGTAVGSFFLSKEVPAASAFAFGTGTGAMLCGMHDALKRFKADPFQKAAAAVRLDGDRSQASDPLGDMPLLDMYTASQTPNGTVLNLNGPQSADPLGSVDMNRVEVVEESDLLGAFSDPCA